MPVEAPTRGCLFAIGGHEARRGQLTVLEEFVRHSGGPGISLVVLTAASRDPEKRVRDYDPAFRSLGIEDLSFFHQEHREQSSSPEVLDAVARADSVFFCGGNQLKLVTAVAASPLEALLRERFDAGMHLGGTSAGASALSAIMIARGKGRSSARLSSVRMSPGLGFAPGLIVDQHFRERDRFGRLFAAVACNPALIGLGLDEDTAFALDAANRLTVFGSGSLTVVDGANLAATDIDDVPEDSPAAFAGMQLHVLTAGWTFDAKSRRVGEQPVLDLGREPELESKTTRETKVEKARSETSRKASRKAGAG